MHLTPREFWTAFHGLVLGAIYFIAFTVGFAAIFATFPPIFGLL